MKYPKYNPIKYKEKNTRIFNGQIYYKSEMSVVLNIILQRKRYVMKNGAYVHVTREIYYDRILEEKQMIYILWVREKQEVEINGIKKKLC